MSDDARGRAAPAWAGPRVLGPDATAAAFPLGGIGTGTVSVGARGELRDWELANTPAKGTRLPFTFFALWARPEGGEAVTRVLEAREPPPYVGDSGLHLGRLAGLPRLAGCEVRGTYPLLRIDFTDPELPVEVALEAFTPLVPLDVAASGIPGAVLRYRVTNPGPVPVDVTVAGSLSNPVAITGRDVFTLPRYAGHPSVDLRRADGLTGLCFGTDLPTTDLRHGSVVLATADPDVTATPRWVVDHWADGAQLLWDDLTADGRLGPQPPSLEVAEGAEPDWEHLPRLRTGSLASSATLAPGETRDLTFLLTWHLPNRPRAWLGMVGLPDTHADQVVQHAYARRFADAWAVAAHLSTRLPLLEDRTRAFVAALHGSTLPSEVVDAVSATMVVLRSTTCLLLDDGSAEGRFAAWEGSFDAAGSCEGTCTHVWGYAQTAAWLFPSLERSARRTELGEETLPDGRMRFRTNAPFGGEPLDFHPAVDGQLGTVLRFFREWRASGDEAFLRELWPAARRALDYAAARWDTDGDGVLDGVQHTTYDIELHGPNPLGSVLHLAALRAGVELAHGVGDEETAHRWTAAADAAGPLVDQLLFDGEHYVQRTDDPDAVRYQVGLGCLSDQLLGQTWAHLYGLGHVLPPAHARSAAAAVHRHNFRRSLHGHASVQRTYALEDEAGLVLCSWPRGGRPRIPFVYCDEVWSGTEYAVATLLAYEGLVDEALEVVRAVRDRHDGVRRSPWNEAECGNHYARSLASWGVLVALTGTAYDARVGELHLAPVRAALRGEEFSTFVTTAHGWGTCAAGPSGAWLRLEHGELCLDALSLLHPTLGRFGLPHPLTLHAGEQVRLVRLRDDPEGAPAPRRP